MKKPRGYISGAMTSYGDLAQNIERARVLGDEVRKVGGWAYVPHQQTGHPDTAALHDYDEWIDDDLDMLEKCDFVALVSGWERSRGARIEEEAARKLGKPIFYPDLPGSRQLIAIAEWIKQNQRRSDPSAVTIAPPREQAKTLPDVRSLILAASILAPSSDETFGAIDILAEEDTLP